LAMTYRKKLIEVALPLEAINVASAREKSIRHGHPSTLHLWWARRPLAACRAVIFTSLIDDPDDPHAPPDFVTACKELPKGKNATVEDTPRQRLFDFIERLVTWEATTDEKILNTARELIRLSTDGNPPPLLDPFAGGGSIPLEAQRLGLEAHASDLNPVAVMINKALIEIPPKFANQPPVNPRDRQKMGSDATWKGAAGLAADVGYYGEWLRDRAYEKIGHLYPDCNGETVIAWLWARTVKCPNPACGAIMPLTSTFSLSTKKGKKVWVEPVIDQRNKKVSFELNKGKGKPPEPTKVGRGVQFRCLACGETASEEHIKSEGKARRMHAQMIGMVTEGAGGRNYFAPTPFQEKVVMQANPDWKPDFEMSTHPQYMAPPRYGMTMFSDLFMPRQLLALETLSNLVDEAKQQAYEDAINAGFPVDSAHLETGGTGSIAYSEAIGAYLGLTVGRQVNRLSTLCFWDSGRENVQQVFSRQALTMNWNYVEANPFSNSSGNFLGQLGYPIKMLGNTTTFRSGFVGQKDATARTYSHSMIVSTDPPYYDNVPYADLSDFFYVWLRLSLRHIYPSIFGTMLVPKDDELVADHQRYGGRDDANEFFEDGMKRVFTKLCNSTNPNYPITVYYAFRQAESEDTKGTASTGWETMLEGLVHSGYSVQATWPMRTEQATNIKKYRNALASSIVLVCRPRPDDAPITSRRDFVNALRRELPAALRQMQSGNIAPVDLAQASIGPGMAVYSRYRQVLEANGDPLTVRTALQLINQVLDEFLAETEGDLDGDSRFAVAWFEQYGFNSGQFGVADVLARAKNTSVDGLHNAGLLAASAGNVRLLTWEELDPGWQPADDDRLTVWEATHHLIERLNVHGEEGAALLLAKMSPDLAASARQLAYRLYAICERKGWADHARDYNALVTSWSASQEQAVRHREAYQQKRLFE
jgi:putative DNA methylase